MIDNPQPKQTIDYVNHILFMRQWDEDYARQALIDHDTALPWMNIKQGVKDAIKGLRSKPEAGGRVAANREASGESAEWQLTSSGQTIGKRPL